MDFENQYLTHREYEKLGGKIQKESFNLLEYKAEKEVDIKTKKRFKKKKIEDFPQELKLCIYELIEVISNEDNSNILSESVGSYNITRMSKQDIEKNKNIIIKKYLSDVKVDGVYVLYCGEDIDN